MESSLFLPDLLTAHEPWIEAPGTAPANWPTVASNEPSRCSALQLLERAGSRRPSTLVAAPPRLPEIIALAEKIFERLPLTVPIPLLCAPLGGALEVNQTQRF